MPRPALALLRDSPAYSPPTRAIFSRISEHLELAHKLAPQNPTPCLLLAMAYRKRGQVGQAQAMLAIVNKLNQEQARKRRQAMDANH